MAHLLIKISILISIFSSSFGALAKQINNSLPPILDFYPSCSYEVIETTYSKKTALQPTSRKTTDLLLKRLRLKAKTVGADAIILTDRKSKKSAKSKLMAFTTLFEVSYHAEFIKNCEDNLDSPKKAATFNHLGMRTIDLKGKVLSSPEVLMSTNLKQSEKEKLQRAITKTDINNLPPILNYYPDCSYEIIKTASSTEKTEQPLASKTTQSLFKHLREEAKNVGADALILTARKINKAKDQHDTHRMTKTKTLYMISYQAELIKSCKGNLGANKKVTAFNHLGEKILSFKNEIQLSAKVVINTEKAKLHRPIVTNQEVSLEHGLYGVKIGSDYQQVVAVFGVPSIELNLLHNELLVGYGRRHWLHFQDGELVKIQNKSEYLSQTIINEIPWFDFFDDYSWRINNKITHGDSLNKVKSALNIDTPLNADDQLIIKQKNNTLVLNFIFVKNMETFEREYSLHNFEMYQSDYQRNAVVIKDKQDSQSTAITQTFEALQQETEIDWQKLKADLGEPMGRITLTANSALLLYNQHLLVNIKKSELNAIHYIKSAFLNNEQLYTNNKLWSLGYFKQNSSVKQLKQYFLENNSEYDGEIEMLADDFKLSLYFEDNENSSSLDEAKLIIY